NVPLPSFVRVEPAGIPLITLEISVLPVPFTVRLLPLRDTFAPLTVKRLPELFVQDRFRACVAPLFFTNKGECLVSMASRLPGFNGMASWSRAENVEKNCKHDQGEPITMMRRLRRINCASSGVMIKSWSALAPALLNL